MAITIYLFWNTVNSNATVLHDTFVFLFSVVGLGPFSRRFMAVSVPLGRLVRIQESPRQIRGVNRHARATCKKCLHTFFMLMTSYLCLINITTSANFVLCHDGTIVLVMQGPTFCYQLWYQIKISINCFLNCHTCYVLSLHMQHACAIVSASFEVCINKALFAIFFFFSPQIQM